MALRYSPEAAGARCDVCPLRGSKVVPPDGDLSRALLLLVGEGPGYQEERQGRPFCGPSGIELAKILADVGLRREDVAITNAMLCRCDTPGVEGKKRYEVKGYLAWLRAENVRRKREAKQMKLPFAPIPSPLECCLPRLNAELAYFEQASLARGQPNGGVVMPLGNFALQSLTGHQGIMRYRGAPAQARLFPNPDLDLDRRAR